MPFSLNEIFDLLNRIASHKLSKECGYNDTKNRYSRTKNYRTNYAVLISIHTQIWGRIDYATALSAEVSGLVWKVIEIVGESKESFADAVRNAIDEAGKTVKEMQWFEATSFRGSIQGSKVSQFRAVVKIGFKVERSANSRLI
jgi:flavin-binding protein dodecin